MSEIKELKKVLTDNPIKTSLVIENLLNPAKEITITEEIIAPKKPNTE